VKKKSKFLNYNFKFFQFLGQKIGFLIYKSCCQVCFSKKDKPRSLRMLLWTPKTKGCRHESPHVSLFAKNPET